MGDSIGYDVGSRVFLSYQRLRSAHRACGARRADDDKPANNERERSRLRELGLVFDNVVSNREAAAQLSVGHYDLVLTDLERSEASDGGTSSPGLHVLELPFIKERLGPPVIVYTGYRQRGRFGQLLAAGAYGATSSPGELERLVLTALGRD